jgi:hypothetical protein
MEASLGSNLLFAGRLAEPLANRAAVALNQSSNSVEYETILFGVASEAALHGFW